VRQEIARDTISTGTRVGRVIKWGATRPVFGPLFIATAFLGLSYAMAPTDEQLALWKQQYDIYQECKSSVLKKYGVVE